MICINCFHAKTSVTNSRPHKKSSGTWRRRKCTRCKQIFTTYERPAFDESIKISYGSGSAASYAHFSLSKLTLSIAASFSHDSVTRQLHSLSLAQTVEQSLIRDVQTPSVDDIAAVTHQTLKRFDEVAAFQYAASHGLVETTRKRRGRPSIK